MGQRSRLLIALLAGGLVFGLAEVALTLTPLGPGPDLPAGATRLHITTAAPHLVPNLGCPAALLAPVRVATSGDDLVVISVETGAPVQVVWPSGWAAWRFDGRAVLVRRDGSVAGREGDLLEGYGGGTDDDGTFHVCVIGG